MPNIFDGIKFLTDNDIIEQIALLETMNMSNISKPIAQKAIKKAVNLINFLGNKIGKDPNIKEPEVKEIWTVLEEKRNELKEYTRDELNQRLKDILIEKSKNKIDEPSEDEISVQVIEEAAKLYKVNEKLMPGKKAEIIYLNYSEKNNENTQEYLKDESMNGVEYEILDRSLNEEEIAKVYYNNKSEEYKEKNEFKKVIEPDKISILNSWRNLDRHMLAKIIWLSVKKYGSKFTPSKEEMPSYVNNEEKQLVIKNEKAFEKLKEEVKEVNNNVNKYADKIKKIDQLLNKENKFLADKIKLMKNTKQDIIKLENLKDTLKEEKKLKEEALKIFEEERKNASLEKLDLLMEEYEKIKLEIFDVNNEINNIIHELTYKSELVENTDKEIDEKDELIKKLTRDSKQTNIEKEKLEEIYESKKDQINNMKIQKRTDILEKWSRTFCNFIIEEDDLENIFDFNIDELIEIEIYLYELNYTKDPQALSMGLIKDGKEKYDYMEVASESGGTFEIWFKVLDDKKIHIVDISYK